MIRYDRITDFSVPEAFIYLCSATGFAPNNYAPVFHLGKERIKKVVICCGADADSLDPTDLKHAIGPAKDLQDTLARQLGLTPEKDIHLIYGDPDRMSDWLRIGEAVKKFADGLPVVANLQGGTTQMSLGINHALDAAKLDWLMVTVTKPPIQTAVTALFGNELDEKFIPLREVVENIPRNLLFAVRKLVSDTAEAIAERAYYATRADVAARIWEKMANSARARDILAMLNRANYDSAKNEPLNLGGLGLDAQLDEISRIYELGSFAAEVIGSRIVSMHLSKFVTGGWLEQAALNHLLRHFGEHRGVKFTLSVPLRKTGNLEDDGEVDILVQHGDNFHVIELKTAAGAKQVRAKHRNQTANNRNIVGGEMARAWLVMPFLTGESRSLSRLEASCEMSHVSLITGLDAFDQLTRQIEALVEG